MLSILGSSRFFTRLFLVLHGLIQYIFSFDASREMTFIYKLRVLVCFCAVVFMSFSYFFSSPLFGRVVCRRKAKHKQCLMRNVL